MTEAEFALAILNNLPHTPTEGQRLLASGLAEFIFTKPENNQYLMFILRGYAGTGKTSMISSLVKALPTLGKKTVLLAPTGRAAKVFSQYSGHPAFTIHRKIYMHQAQTDGMIRITLRKNLHKNTLFIVDEASMIHNETSGNESEVFSRRNLLDDLITYVYSSNCRLLLTGDTAQLPPVGLEDSPALDTKYIKTAYPVSLFTSELTEVVRQEKDSGILYNATLLRQKLSTENYSIPYFDLKQFDDVLRISSNELEDALNENISLKGIENTVVVTRTNKRANLFNNEIRKRILFRDHEVTAGDIMMAVKNNYFWLSPESQAGFIANGDIIEILRVKKITELYGFRFADVQIRLTDYPNEPELEVRILLNTLMSVSASLTKEENIRLFEEVMKDYEAIPSRRERLKQLRANPYFNALQVKFAYALTCHKTQGGQWENIFIDQGYIPADSRNKEYLRWLYTSITRGTRRIYMIGFDDELFKD
ncbi:MAG: AAA family ATPase [Bacteroidales bacterium]|jgi:exodeoxyribonuclease-5|nr:AAA family ATPase [Bacteroidales bacterium]